MSKTISVLVSLVFILGFAGSVLANQAALDTFNGQYPGTSYGCNLCHKAAIPATNPYGADLALPVTAQQLIAIENIDSDGDGATNIDEINAGTFPGNPKSKPKPIFVTITSPNGGEIIPSGSTFTILYDAAAEVSSVKVKYSLDGGATWFSADGAPGMGGFDWNVPTPVKNSTKAVVKVIGFNAANARLGADNSDATFTIDVVSITAPVLNETVTKGGVYPVAWTTNGTQGPVISATVFYTFGTSGIWKRANGTVIDPLGSFDWNVPTPATGKTAKLKVVLKDASGVTVGNAVSKTFRVE